MVTASTVAWTERAGAATQSSSEARLRLMLASGGDERIWLDPVTRRNRYGAPAGPAPDELWFSSSTACAVSERGWAAACAALSRLTSPGLCGVGAWFDQVRARLMAIYGAPGAQAVLSASGTEAELLALALALALAEERPVANIVVAPAETGSGVPLAADGRHFLSRASLGAAVAKSDRLPGWEDARLQLETIDIRDDAGRLRPQDDVDAEAFSRVEAAVRRGAFALLHVLDASKTGRPGVSRAAARALTERLGGRMLAVVDACQLRCEAQTLRRDLGAGLAVMLTGSKFAGGPAFCGALLMPEAVAARAAQARPVGAPLRAYSAALDWPAALRGRFAGGSAQPANLGLGLRWSAALAEIEAYERLPPAQRSALLAAFDRAVRARVAADPGLALLDEETGGAFGLVAIVHADGSDPRGVYEALQAPGAVGARPCHLGQPVVVAGRTALRVCASMPTIIEAAEHGFASVEADLDAAFGAWAKLRA